VPHEHRGFDITKVNADRRRADHAGTMTDSRPHHAKVQQPRELDAAMAHARQVLAASREAIERSRAVIAESRRLRGETAEPEGGDETPTEP
jgi:hypothetical protein